MSVVAILTSTALVASCSATSMSAAGGPGIEFGSSMDEYHSAFEDVEPIEFYAQTPGPQGSLVSDKMEIYYDAITEWSGGKITFEVFYANAIAGASEIDDALGDGRTDIDGFSSATRPAEYPAINTLINASFLGDTSPIAGMLQSHGWLLQSTYGTDEISQEFEDRNMHLLMPSYNGGGMALLCTDKAASLDQLAGRQIAAAGRTQGAQLAGLNAVPVTASYAELYESLQRGVVDCTATSIQNAVLGGYLGLTPNVVIDPDAGFALTFGSVLVNQDRWAGLPLIAQQLLFDRLDVFIETNIRTSWEAIVQGVGEVEDAGGVITEFEPDARERLQSINEDQVGLLEQSEALDDPRTALSDWTSAAAQWTNIIDELGYDSEMTYSEFASFYDDDAIDLNPFVDEVFERILLPHRPEGPSEET